VIENPKNKIKQKFTPSCEFQTSKSQKKLNKIQTPPTPSLKLMIKNKNDDQQQHDENQQQFRVSRKIGQC